MLRESGGLVGTRPAHVGLVGTEFASGAQTLLTTSQSNKCRSRSGVAHQRHTPRTTRNFRIARDPSRPGRIGKRWAASST